MASSAYQAANRNSIPGISVSARPGEFNINPLAGSWGMQPTSNGGGSGGGVYWVGNDGNRYVKDSQGTRSVGQYNQANQYWDNLGYRQIDNWDTNTGHAPNTPDLNGSYYAPSGGGNTASAEQLAQYDQAMNQLRHAEGRIDNQLGISLGNIGTQYGVRSNEIDGQFNKGKGQYDTQTTGNLQQRRTNVNNIDDQASGGLRGLQRLLGSRGAVGSDMTLAGRAVQNDANQKRSGAGATYAQNQRSLDTNWGNFQNEIQDERKKLTDWRNTSESSARAQALSTRQSIANQLAELEGQKAVAQGRNGADAARADINRANAMSGEIDNLAKINPIYDGKARTYTPASLDSYNVGGGVSAEVNGGGAGTGPDMSLYQYGKDDEDKFKKL